MRMTSSDECGVTLNRKLPVPIKFTESSVGLIRPRSVRSRKSTPKAEYGKAECGVDERVEEHRNERTGSYKRTKDGSFSF